MTDRLWWREVLIPIRQSESVMLFAFDEID